MLKRPVISRHGREGLASHLSYRSHRKHGRIAGCVYGWGFESGDVFKQPEHHVVESGTCQVATEIVNDNRDKPTEVSSSVSVLNDWVSGGIHSIRTLTRKPRNRTTTQRDGFRVMARG